jgi:lipopolysaccharide biosynthesis glycosyltransferase
MTNDNKKIIPVFFATDDNYVPFVSVAMKSLLDNASSEYFYNIHILTDDGIPEEHVEMLKQNMTPNSKLIIDMVDPYIEKIEKNLHMSLRDYYTVSIFYRLFIADLYPEYHKAIYLDCDIVVPGDISKMYNIDTEGNIFGAITDDVIATNPDFCVYARDGVGVDADKYFNSGVLLMDLDKYREEKVLDTFINLLTTYNFETAAPDQDYLNAICKDKIKYLDKGWDLMPVGDKYEGEINLIHYNNFRKPWYYDDVPYGDVFWEYAKQTNFYDKILSFKNNFTQEMADKHIKGAIGLLEQTKRIVNSPKNFKKVLFEN